MLMGLVAVGLLAWAAPAAAAGSGGDDRSDRSNLSFLFDKDAFAIMGSQAGGGGSQGVSKLSIRLYGGYSHITAADVNDGSRFYFDLIEYYAAQGEGTVEGSYNPLHGGFNFGADVIYQISPAIGIGVGAGYMRNSADSLATYILDPFEVDILAGSTITAIPIRLGLFFTFPLGGKLNLTANAGAAYYAGLKFDAMQGLDYLDGTWMHMDVAGSRRGAADIGFHGSLGVEYKLSPMMGFFVEVLGRYASFKNFDEVTGIQTDSEGMSDTIVGKLYILTDDIAGTPVSMFTIEETPPVGSEFREPKFDLSGLSLQAGIRIRF
jgi:hypothetical protein